MRKELKWFIWLLYATYVIMFVTNAISYDLDVYDCSNMCADQYVIFDKLGLDPCYILDFEEGHAYLCLQKLNMCWESTALIPRMMSDGGV